MEKELGARLLCVAESIPPCRSLVDCGCDHGFVSIYAAKRGIAERITASDINRGPLKNAEKEIAAARLSGRIKTVLTNGLDDIEHHESVVIAGMGGETIIDIISRAEWTRRDCTLILQPMTKTELLREWLYNEGFAITDEKFVEEGGHLYSVIVARFCGKVEFEPFEKYMSRAAIGAELAETYADKIISRLTYELEKKIEASAMSAEEKARRESDLASLNEMRKKL